MKKVTSCLLGMVATALSASGQCPAPGTIFVNAVPSQNVCGGSAAGGQQFTGSVATSFNWTSSGAAIGPLPARGRDALPLFAAHNTGASDITATYQVTPVRYHHGFSYVAWFDFQTHTSTFRAIDNANGLDAGRFFLPSPPMGIAIGHGQGKVYVALRDDLEVVDTATMLPIQQRNNIFGNTGIAVSGNHVFVSQFDNQRIQVYDNDLNFLTDIFTEFKPAQMEVSHDGSRLYVPYENEMKIGIYNASTLILIGTIDVGQVMTSRIAFSPDDSRVYVPCGVIGQVKVFDTQNFSFVRSYNTDQTPNGVDLSPDGSRLYVACGFNGNLDVIDVLSGARIKTISTLSGTTAVSVSSSGSRFYVYNGNHGHLDAYDAATFDIVMQAVNDDGSHFTNHFVSSGPDCAGTPTNFTITVAPERTASIYYAGGPFCGNEGTIAPSIIGETGGQFSATSGLTIDAATGQINPSASSAGNYTVTYTLPSMGSCSGFSVTTQVSINPPSNFVAQPNHTYCAGAAVPATDLTTGQGSTVTWINTQPGIGLPASGTGDLPGFTAVNAGTTPITASILLNGSSGQPSKAYIPNLVNSTVSVVSTSTQTVIKTIPVAPNPLAVEPSHDGTFMMVSHPFAGAISIISTATDTVVRKFPIAFSAFTLRLSKDDKTVYATDTNHDVHIIDVASGLQTGVIALGATNSAQALELSPDGQELYVGTGAGLLVVQTSNQQIVDTIMGVAASDMVVSPNGRRLYTCDGYGCYVQVVNLQSRLLQATINLPVPAAGVAISPDGNRIAVATENNKSVVLLDAYNLQVLSTVVLPATPGMLAFGNDGQNVFVFAHSPSQNQLYRIAVANPVAGAPVVCGSAAFMIGRFLSPGSTCPGGAGSFTITINPAATAAQQADKAFCAGSMAPALPFSGGGPGTTYTWTNSNPSIGLMASGNGGLPAFNAINNSNAVVNSTITVVAANSNGCSGAPMTFTLNVNPKPTIGTQSNQILCTGSNSTAVNFTSNIPGATFAWTNSNPGIGLPASGSGNIAPFLSQNATAAPITGVVGTQAQYTANGITCSSNNTVFQITVNPNPTLNTPPNVAYCAGSAVPALPFSGSTPGTVFLWSNSNPAIGLPASGTGNLPAYTAVNNTTVPVNATITVTPKFTNGGKTCFGAPSSFTITVNPPQTGSTSILYTGSPYCINAGVVPVSVTGSAGGSFSATPAGLSINAGSGAVSTAASVPGTYSVTYNVPGVGGSCPQTASTSITIKNTATANIQYNGSPFCPSGNAFPSVQGTLGGTFSATPAGLTINASTGQISLGASAAGTFTVTYSVSSGSGCANTSATASVTVLQSPTVNPVSNQSYCNGSTAPGLTFSGPVGGSTFSWTNSNTSIGLSAAGNGNLPAFGATNGGTTPALATISVKASIQNGAATCIGKNMSFMITVNPTPNISAVSSQSLCKGTATTPVSFTSNVAGTMFTWSNNNTAIGLAAAGSGNIAAFTAQNATLNPIVATVQATPVYKGCSGTPTSFQYTVLPCITATGPGTSELVRSKTPAPTPILVAPNPTTGTVEIQAGTGPVDVQLIDAGGKVLQQTRTASGSFRINLATYSAGSYLLRLRLADGSSVQRILVRL